MSRYLLDTNVALVALMEPDLLTDRVRTAVEAGPNYLSVLVYWEVVLKSMKGKLDVGDPRAWWPDALDGLSATVVPVRTSHVADVCQLPALHQDPFDRLLIATARVEELTLVTLDRVIMKYASSGVDILQQ